MLLSVIATVLALNLLSTYPWGKLFIHIGTLISWLVFIQ